MSTIKQIMSLHTQFFKKNGITVIVILAGTRENFYNELKEYMKKL
jgi:hypothetical protein